MRDVASLAGVSLKTVSRVVNVEPGVSEPVRERVLRAVGQLDYRHNLAASNLRRSGGRTGVIGALLQDVGNSFSSSLLRSIEDAGQAQGVVVLASSLDEQEERERRMVEDLVSRRVDALVLMPATDRQDYLVSEHRAGMPIVFVDRAPRGIDVDSVTVDNRGAAREAVAHLVQGGHRRIALLHDLSTIRTAVDRRAGYEDGLRAAGIRLDPDLVVGDIRGPGPAQAAVERVLDVRDPPTAVFATRNELAIGTARALRARGLRHRVAVVGFDDFPLADMLEPGLTVVRQNVKVIGAEVARLLFARLAGDAEAPEHVVVAHELVPRGSGEIVPVPR